MNTTNFQVLKADLHQSRFTSTEQQALKAGECRLAVDRFSFTANNITYATFGDAMSYWKFFPTPDLAWGSIPVWGFATVAESRCDGVEQGMRFYGYYPMASHVTVTPTKVNEHGFSDGAANRSELHPVYNQYVACKTDPLYSQATENVQALLRPLFVTSFLIDDFLADNEFFGASAGGKTGVMLLSSASSKTAYGTAFQLAQRSGLEVVGLTSAANIDFCKSLGCYHRVLAYDQLDQIDSHAACIYIDFAGSANLRRSIHTDFKNLAHSCSIGGTHVDELALKGAGKDLPGVRATLFFAPAQIKKRSTDWGAAGLREKLVAAWQAFIQRAAQGNAPWLLAHERTGQEKFEAVYREVLAGGSDPRTGYILKF